MAANRLRWTRLVRELKDLTESPVPGCSAWPADECLATWHCCVAPHPSPPPPSSTTSAPTLCAILFPELSFDLKFPSDYPFSPPQLHLTSQYCAAVRDVHPSYQVPTHLGGGAGLVDGGNGQIGHGRHVLCLELLATQKHGVSLEAFYGFNSAISVRAILVSAQDVLAQVAAAFIRRRGFGLPPAAPISGYVGRAHGPEKKDGAIPAALVTAMRSMVIEVEVPVQRQLCKEQEPADCSSKVATAAVSSVATGSDDGWQMVHGKRTRSQVQQGLKGSTDIATVMANLGRWNASTLPPGSPVLSAPDSPAAVAAKAAKKAAEVAAQAHADVEAQRRHLRKTRKRLRQAFALVAKDRELGAQDGQAGDRNTTGRDKDWVRKVQSVDVLKERVEFDDAQLGKLRAAAAAAEAAAEAARRDAEASLQAEEERKARAMSSLDTALPNDLLIAICSELNAADNAALRATCRRLREAADDGQVWRALYERTHGNGGRGGGAAGRPMRPVSLQGWRALFQAERAKLLSNLKCFLTKQHFAERPVSDGDEGGDGVVLGMPLRFTINPRTRAVDHIECSPDLVSMGAASALLEGEVVTAAVDPFGMPFTHVLPVFLTLGHFERALPHIRRTLLSIVSSSSSSSASSFWPSLALVVLPKAINTQLVLLADGGTSAGRALQVIAYLHRLMLAFGEAFPQLEEAATRRLENFIHDPKARSKEAEPCLGALLPLLSITPRLSWTDVVAPYFAETMDRGVLWACREHPRLARVPRAGGANRKRHHVSALDRRDLTLSATRVSLGHACRASWLAQFIFRSSTSIGGGRRDHGGLGTVATLRDAAYGAPTGAEHRDFSIACERVERADSWPEFLGMIGLRVPSPAALATSLEQSVRNSVRKGYHKRNMDFSRVHSRGVSSILQRGQTYRCQPNIRHLRLEDVWSRRDSPLYLDATVLLCNSKGECLVDRGGGGIVDYRARRSRCGAVRHSGDLLDDEAGTGRHTIDVDVSRLPSSVSALWFVISAFAGPTLSAIAQPFIRIVDCGSSAGEDGEEVARYKHEHSGCKSTAVAMCRLERSGTGGAGGVRGWRIVAVGEPTDGCANRYDPIRQTIRRLTAVGAMSAH